jgi:hypothetical protein
MDNCGGNLRSTCIGNVWNYRWDRAWDVCRSCIEDVLDLVEETAEGRLILREG